MLKLSDYLEALENERKKIEAFQRELPYCMQLLDAGESTDIPLPDCQSGVCASLGYSGTSCTHTLITTSIIHRKVLESQTSSCYVLYLQQSKAVEHM